MRLFLVVIICCCVQVSSAVETSEYKLSPAEDEAINAIRRGYGIIQLRTRTDQRVYAIELRGKFTDKQYPLLGPLLQMPVEILFLEGAQLSDSNTCHLIGKLASLDKVSVTGKQFNDESIQGVSQLQNLTQLTIQRTANTGQLFRRGGFGKLQYMTLGHLSWNELDYAHLSQLKLKSLRLVRQELNAASAIALSGLANLEYLYLGDCEVDDDAWQNLSKLPALKTLVLHETKTANKVFARMPDFAKLERIEIAQPGLSIETTRRFASFPKMKSIQVTSDNIKAAELMELDRAINEPRLRENLRRGHLAGYPISEEQIKKLGLTRPLAISSNVEPHRFDTFNQYNPIPLSEHKNHWYPPQWAKRGMGKAGGTAEIYRAQGLVSGSARESRSSSYGQVKSVSRNASLSRTMQRLADGSRMV